MSHFKSPSYYDVFSGEYKEPSGEAWLGAAGAVGAGDLVGGKTMYGLPMRFVTKELRSAFKEGMQIVEPVLPDLTPTSAGASPTSAGGFFGDKINAFTWFNKAGNVMLCLYPRAGFHLSKFRTSKGKKQYFKYVGSDSDVPVKTEAEARQAQSDAYQEALGSPELVSTSDVQETTSTEKTEADYRQAQSDAYVRAMRGGL